MTTVTKKELVERIAQQTGLQRNDVKTVVQGFLDAVVEELSKVYRPSRRGGAIIRIKPKKTATIITINPKNSNEKKTSTKNNGVKPKKPIALAEEDCDIIRIRPKKVADVSDIIRIRPKKATHDSDIIRIRPKAKAD